MPLVSDFNRHEGQLGNPLSELACVSIHIYYTPFPPNKHFPSFTTFHFCGDSFWQSQKARGLVTSLWSSGWVSCSHLHDLASISGQGVEVPEAPTPSCRVVSRTSRYQNAQDRFSRRIQKLLVWLKKHRLQNHVPLDFYLRLSVYKLCILELSFLSFQSYAHVLLGKVRIA